MLIVQCALLRMFYLDINIILSFKNVCIYILLYDTLINKQITLLYPEKTWVCAYLGTCVKQNGHGYNFMSCYI